MKIAVFRTSYKENEKRIPIFPEHIKLIPKNIIVNMVFEDNYGVDYNISNDSIVNLGASIAKRHDLFEIADILILPKPTISDFNQMREKQIVWGWVHCVQQKDIVQIAIDKKLTLITWEAMNIWGVKGDKLMHSFYKNNELAGYTAILHTLELKGLDGMFGSRKKVVIMGYGSVSKGAILSLMGRGFNNIHVLTNRPTHKVSDQNPDVYYKQYIKYQDGIFVKSFEDGEKPLLDEFKNADIIVNGILQDTDNPIIFITNNDISKLKQNSIIVDISCDEKMGFEFAIPTTFEKPIINLDNGIDYYSVDHTPTYLWNSASREISRIVIPYLEIISSGEMGWMNDVTIKNAIEINRGIIRNEKILSFQKRKIDYPHFFL